jgi:hypothetical protein
LQWSHASIRASSSSVCTHVLRCVTIMVGNMLAMPALTLCCGQIPHSHSHRREQP